jgi:hypothetical protein
MTRLTPVNKTRLFLKLSDFDKHRLVAFHSLCYNESDFTHGKHESEDGLDSTPVVTN